MHEAQRCSEATMFSLICTITFTGSTQWDHFAFLTSSSPRCVMTRNNLSHAKINFFIQPTGSGRVDISEMRTSRGGDSDALLKAWLDKRRERSGAQHTRLLWTVTLGHANLSEARPLRFVRKPKKKTTQNRREGTHSLRLMEANSVAESLLLYSV